MTTVLYTLEIEPETDTPESVFGPEPGLTASERHDCEMTVRWIRRQLERGNTFAWFTARVCATLAIGDHVFAGIATLGGCSYESRDAFLADPIYADLCDEARDELVADLARAAARGEAALQAAVAIDHPDLVTSEV